MSNVKHERGCGCDRCIKRREYAKNRYHANKAGKTYSRPRKAAEVSIEPKPAGYTGRLVETPQGPGSGLQTIHWMPTGVEEWECPHCGEWFKYAPDTGWTQLWVA